MTKSQINRALRLAYAGTTRQRDDLQNELGDSLTSILNEAWADADDAGETALAKRCERAFNHLTGE
tara:strand:- start:248 stop:445 length:198 start_codon:yes stop_codon:yes gene_type:complete